MDEFFLLVLILFGAFWGSAFLWTIIKAISKRLAVAEVEGEGNTALLREELEALSGRLERVEEELDFYKRLKAPDQPES